MADDPGQWQLIEENVQYLVDGQTYSRDGRYSHLFFCPTRHALILDSPYPEYRRRSVDAELPCGYCGKMWPMPPEK
jgi:hypothetical protein